MTANSSARWGLSGSTLKLIACLIMIIDHTAVALLKYGILTGNPLHLNEATILQLNQLYQILRKVGRPAFPIFCFLIVEGFVHTRNEWSYFRKLLLFSFVSELPFDLALGKLSYFRRFSLRNALGWIRELPNTSLFYHQNVYFTLAIGLLVLIAMKRFDRCLLLQLTVMILGMKVALLMKTDYSFKGVGMISILYLYRASRPLQVISGVLTSAWEMPAPAAYLLISLYNGKRGAKLKYFFYFFYPVHLLVLAVIRILINPLG